MHKEIELDGNGVKRGHYVNLTPQAQAVRDV